VNTTEVTREHLEDLLKSETFQRSPKLSRLLRHLVEPALGRAPQPIKEQLLGIEVFDRAADWDPQTDSIVRVNVNRLRLTLKSYYADQNPPPPCRFEIPRGSYAARCVPTSSPDSFPSQKFQAGSAVLASKREKSPTLAASPQSARVRVPEIRLRRLTYESGDVTNAAFGPDGDSVIYSARWRGEPVSIYSQRIGKKHGRPLGLPPGKLRDVSATGKLLFTLGEGPIGVLAQAELSGGPLREIVDSVSDAIWLPDNKSIAAARIENGKMRVELPLGSPVHYLAGNQTDIRLSLDPTGTRVAFVDSSLGRLDFCVAETDGPLRRISQGWRVGGGILWSSADRLLLSGTRRGAPAIYSLDLGGSEESIYPTPATFVLHDRSPSGRILAACVDSRLNVAFRTGSMQSEERVASLVNTRLVGLTPDARFAVLMDLLGDGVARNSPILLVALPTGQPVQIAEGYYPQLAPDGKEVICLERTQSETVIVVTPIPSGLPRRYPLDPSGKYHSAEFAGMVDRFVVHLIDDDGGLQSRVFAKQSGRLSTIPGTRYITLIAPNGSWGVVPGGSDLRIAHLETGETRRICGLRTGWSPLRWSTSGNEIFISEPGADHATTNLSRINVHTGEQNPWFTLRPADGVGAYLLKWIDIAPDGRSYAYTYQQDLSDLYVLDGLS